MNTKISLASLALALLMSLNMMTSTHAQSIDSVPQPVGERSVEINDDLEEDHEDHEEDEDYDDDFFSDWDDWFHEDDDSFEDDWYDEDHWLDGLSEEEYQAMVREDIASELQDINDEAVTTEVNALLSTLAPQEDPERFDEVIDQAYQVLDAWYDAHEGEYDDDYTEEDFAQEREEILQEVAVDIEELSEGETRTQLLGMFEELKQQQEPEAFFDALDQIDEVLYELWEAEGFEDEEHDGEELTVEDLELPAEIAAELPPSLQQAILDFILSLF